MTEHPPKRSSPSPAARSRGRLWPVIILGLIGANVSVCAVTVFYAVSDRSFAVEPGYDRKARDWDQTARERDRSAKLGWTARWTLPQHPGDPIILDLKDRDDRAITDASVRITAFHRTRAAKPQRLSLLADATGAYSAAISLDRPGLWELQFTADRAGSRFVDAQTLTVPIAIVGEPQP